MRQVWFRARSYGWGWTPVTVAGWLVVAGYFIATMIDVFVLIYRLRHGADLASAMPLFLLVLAILVAMLMGICRATGERPRWRWGR
jgi:uncharacterized membrane protein